ncbi:Uncharacterised protein [Enterocloster clostridioformis]|uniref:Uncharacterized protein n=1 Tax=Enterocloster clostridioformis TaxID=1531 RepID=A0A174M2M2_9FIRM|nr:Uncharacterised protein [Enterocloster clostridioformis]
MLRNEHFNPLHHEGGDPRSPRSPAQMYHFNPLHHEGGDFVPSANFFFLYRFQSTPPRGWRLSSSFGICISVHFNPLHHEGGDCADQWLPVVVQYFNPLHHEGGDQRPQQNRLCLSIFQSTPPRGWRRKRGTFYGKINRFQSTPPRGWRQIKVKRNTVATYISIHSTTRVET